MITHIFIDLGGVLLTNGWDRNARARAVEKFGLDAEETQERHHLTFDTYEVGKVSLEDYLKRVVFYKKRNFTQEEFATFMYAQSKSFPEMIDLIKKLKEKYTLKIAVVNNEGKELNEHRIAKFKLTAFVDFFISSALVHFRKPDLDIFKMALNVAQAKAKNVLYIDDRDMFVEVAATIGIKGIVHTSYEDTIQKLKNFNLEL